ncbi:hypothetical protein BAG01nite_41160 [Brevibacillus agri]|uniref:Uncharacterized protein n=1 Tax=Brevibacillus agri TaxID=51101 RepID=A0A3M8B6I5_9BACL|nr:MULTISPECIES: hypothetical protein [Brevibacillus]ELK42593.1 hypothetical protein D478_07953 [Brevibacillus agri BAB-2500]EJL43420.1 hypothetical protein PMI08_02666 [Brevibacillus sp. CF112]MBG9567053.1 hypothetical protein [Brevibacillus agri]MBY0050845.1 hypothetical protein [Brevibacillus agri]MCG5251825.1 hypothetical protein [Brevibacillus agri]
MLHYPGIYYAIFGLIFLVGLFLTIRYAKRQETKEVDNNISQTTVKHKVLGNVGMLFYLGAFAVLLAILLISVLVY